MAEIEDAGRKREIPLYARMDVIGGALVIACALLIWFGAIRLEVGQFPRFGAGAMPRALAVLLLVGGCGVLLRGLLNGDRETESIDIALRPIVFIVSAMLIFGLFIRGGHFGFVHTPQLGFLIVGPVTVFVAGCAAPQVRAGELLVTAFGVTAILLLVFVDILGVNVRPFPQILEAGMPAAISQTEATRLAYGVYAALAILLHFLNRRFGEKRGG